MSLYQFECQLKVSFEDLDPMNVVWHGNYMRYMEQARCELLDKLNYTYMDMKADGFAYPVAKMKVKYIKPALFRDILTLRLDIISIEPSLDIKYTMFNNSGYKIFEGQTMQICLNTNTMQSVYTPPQRLVLAIKRLSDEK